MALIICPECQKEVSDQAKKCPHCGYPLKRKIKKPKVLNAIDGSSALLRQPTFSHKKFILVIPIILIIIVVLLVINFVPFVPNLKNMPLESATALLDKKGITYKIINTYTSDYDKDIIYEQDLSPYTIYDKKQILTLNVSLGREYSMPSLVGQPIDSLDDLSEDLTFTVSYENSYDYEQNIIIKQFPTAGTVVNNSSDISFVISKGLYKTLPDFKGLSEDDVKKALSDLNLKSNIKYEYNDSEKGTVYYYTPAVYANDGDEITIFISKGSGYTIPDATGLSEESALALLEKAGFNVLREYTYSDISVDDCSDSTQTFAVSQSAVGTVGEKKDITLTISKPAVVISRIDWDINSVGGVDTYIYFKNCSDKQIAYISFYVTYYDRMGKKAYCEISHNCDFKLDYTGPLNSGKNVNGSIYWSAVIYNSTVDAVLPNKIEIDFSDGTKQTITNNGMYWYGSDFYGGDLQYW